MTRSRLRLTSATGCYGSLGRKIQGTALALLVGLGIACEPRPDSPRRIYLVTIDTLRADHLGCYGYPRQITPFLDRLASDGLLFENALASSSTTMASHTSLFSSLYPPQHRLLRNGQELHESVYTMAEFFRDHGYETAAFTTVDFTRSLSRGFDTFDSEKRYFPAEHVLKKASRWLTERRDSDRLFVWIHLFDVHEWYRRKHLDPDFRGSARQSTTVTESDLLRELERNQGISSDFFGDTERLFDTIDRYDDQLASVDSALASFARLLRREELDREALWIVTGDHGEGLGSHRFQGHGGRLYNEQLRVPLILHFADRRFGSRRIERMVRHVDLLPTLAELLDEPLDQQVLPVAGKSLVSLLSDDGLTFEPRTAFAQRRDADARRLADGWEPGEVYSLQTEDFKYLYHSQAEDEFFDLRSDPQERENLIAEPLEIKDKMRARLAEIFETMSDEGEHLGTGEILPEHIEELKTLGYL